MTPMRYLPHTQEDIREMLQVVGAADLDGLFAGIPADCLDEGPQFPKVRRLDETLADRSSCLKD
jgi:glycine cleavage system pyridoxal-binding protein P